LEYLEYLRDYMQTEQFRIFILNFLNFKTPIGYHITHVFYEWNDNLL